MCGRTYGFCRLKEATNNLKFDDQYRTLHTATQTEGSIAKFDEQCKI